MKKFTHAIVRDLEQLLVLSQEGHRLYVQKDLDFFQNTAHLLEKTQAVMERYNYLKASSTAQTLIADLTSVQRGMDPYNFIKLTEHKRDIQFLLCFKILKEAIGLITDKHQQLQALLDQTKKYVEDLLIIYFHHLQGQLHDPKKFQLPDANQIWATTQNDPNGQLLQNKILFEVTVHDALILLDQTLGKIQQNYRNALQAQEFPDFHNET